MVRRDFSVAGWSVAGAAVAAALVASAFSVAGTRLTEPATPIRVSAPVLVPQRGDQGTAVTETPSTRRSSPSSPVSGDEGRTGSGMTGPSEPAGDPGFEPRREGDD
jgi:hypothetical protein